MTIIIKESRTPREHSLVYDPAQIYLKTRNCQLTSNYTGIVSGESIYIFL